MNSEELLSALDRCDKTDFTLEATLCPMLSQYLLSSPASVFALLGI